MLRSLSFSGGERGNGGGSPIVKIWRYLSTTELSGYKSEEMSIEPNDIVDNGHPLGLGHPRILHNIFSYLNASDLIKIRPVSCRWNHVACQHLRRKLGPCRIRPSKLKQFIRLMRRCFCNPFGSYAIRIENLNDLQIRNFFRRFNLDIIQLRVKIASDEIPDFFNRVLNKLGNLEHLHLIRLSEGNYMLRAKDYEPPSAWVHGVYHFPKLKSITFERDETNVPFIRNYDGILSRVLNSAGNLVKIAFIGWDSHFARLISRCGISNPKSFDGSTSFANSNPYLHQDLIELFFEHRLQFKALKFSIDKRIPLELVMDLTLQTAENLYHLSLINENSSELFQCSLKLHRLVTLVLQGWSGPVDFPSMQHQFPTLKMLKLNAANFIQYENIPEPLIQNLDTLIVMPPDEKWTENNPVDYNLMKKLVKMFPDIKDLRIQVEGNESIQLIYEFWPKIKSLWLDVRGNKTDDEALTGIAKNDIFIKGQKECGCDIVVFRKKAKKDIGTLRDLHTLHLRVGAEFTNVSLTYGISSLTKLETLGLLPSFSIIRSEEEDVPDIGMLEIDGTLSENSLMDFNMNNKNSLTDSQNMIFHNPLKPWCLREIGDNLKHLKHLKTFNDVVYSEEDIQYLHDRLPNLLHEYRD